MPEIANGQWHSVHVYYYEPDKTGLILDAVRPLLAELPEHAATGYFVRHWLRGPHLRVQVYADPAGWDSVVRPLVQRRLSAHLAAHPSTVELDQEQELAAHAKLAEVEQESAPLTPWQPDNTVVVAEYDYRPHVLGTREAALQLADFHVDTTALALAVLDDTRAGKSYLDLAMGLMFASAQAACPPVTKGALSYRSHAEGFLANVTDPTGMRTRFDALYARNRDGLTERLAGVLAQLDGSGSSELPYVAEWAEIVRRYYDRSQDLAAAGNLPMPRIPRPDEVPGSSLWTTVSPFHQAMFGNDEIRRELNDAEWFHTYRVILNYQYLFFSRLGVTPIERFSLCYLAARTVEEVYDVQVPALLAGAMGSPAHPDTGSGR